MKPSYKSPEMEQALTNFFGIDRAGSIKKNICTWCKKPAKKFRDVLSAKEYTISGLCQECQDSTFGGEE